MKKFRILLIFILAVFLLPPLMVFAMDGSDGEGRPNPGSPVPLFYLEDKANLFTEEEIRQLTEQGESLSRENNISMAILTTDDDLDKPNYLYGDDILNQNGIGYGDNFSYVYMLINMDRREVYIGSMGDGMKFFNEARVEDMLDRVYPSLSDGEYAESAHAALGQMNRWLEVGEIEGHEELYPPGPFFSLRRIVLSLLIFLGTGGFAYAITYSDFEKKVRAEYDNIAKRPAYDLKTLATAQYAVINDRIIAENTSRAYSPITSSSTRSGSSRSAGSSGGRSFSRRSSGGRRSSGSSRKF